MYAGGGRRVLHAAWSDKLEGSGFWSPEDKKVLQVMHSLRIYTYIYIYVRIIMRTCFFGGQWGGGVGVA